MDVLRQIDDWPVDHAVAILIGGEGELRGQHGNINRVYHLASVTKLLSTMAFLVALEEEAIELDEPAGPSGSTVRHLISHTAGYAFDSETILFPAGTSRGYSNFGFDVLAKHLEHRTGISFPEYAHEAVFAPLRMSNTTITGSSAKDGYSNATDLAKFARQLINPTLVTKQTLQNATRTHFPGLAGNLPGYGHQEQNTWGLGFEIRSMKSPHWTGKSHPRNTFGHFGQSGTFIWVDPDHQLACCVLTDRKFGPWAKKLWASFNEDVLSSAIDSP